MIYKFRITSSEDENFLREIEIQHEETYLNFHNCLQESLAYDASQMASFYQVNRLGEKGREIALFEMNLEEDEDLNVVPMDVSMIREFVSEKSPLLIYVFDFFSDRFLLIELVAITQKKGRAKYPKCVTCKGEAPEQIKLDAENFNMDDIDLTAAPTKDDYDFLEGFDDGMGDDDENGPTFESLDDYKDLV